MRKLLNLNVALLMVFVVAFTLIASCATIQKGENAVVAWWNKGENAVVAWWNKEQPKVAAFVTGAQKSLATIQKDYSFFASIVITGGALVGITITQADMEKVKAWVAAADANLSVVGPVVSGQPMDGGAVQNAIIATNKVIPALKADALKSETIAALYNAWLAAQAAKAAAQPAPAPAPAK